MIVRSTVAANRATNAGGGLAINGDTLRLGNSTVARNTADGPGGGVYLVKADSRITKSTLNGNVAHASGAGIYQSASTSFWSIRRSPGIAPTPPEAAFNRRSPAAR